MNSCEWYLRFSWKRMNGHDLWLLLLLLMHDLVAWELFVLPPPDVLAVHAETLGPPVAVYLRAYALGYVASILGIEAWSSAAAYREMFVNGGNQVGRFHFFAGP